jgi:hypothetical protein
MKATLEFDLDQPEDRRQHLQCVKANATLCAIHSFEEKLRRRIKDSDGDPDGALCMIYWQQILYEELEAHEVDLDELLR